MKLFNPTNNYLSVRIFGVDYSVEPQSETPELDEDTAKYWQTLHAFLEVPKVKLVEKEVVVEKKAKVTKEK